MSVFFVMPISWLYSMHACCLVSIPLRQALCESALIAAVGPSLVTKPSVMAPEGNNLSLLHRYSDVVRDAHTAGKAHCWQHSLCSAGQHEAPVRLPGACLPGLPVEALLQVDTARQRSILKQSL